MIRWFESKMNFNFENSHIIIIILLLFLVLFLVLFICVWNWQGTNIFGKIWYLVSSPCYIKRFHFKKSWTGAASSKFIRTDDLHKWYSFCCCCCCWWLGFCPKVEIQGFANWKNLSTVTGCWYSHNSTWVLTDGGGCSVCIPTYGNELHASAFECYGILEAVVFFQENFLIFLRENFEIFFSFVV